MINSREQQFHVYLYERIVGCLHQHDNLTRFVFEPDYWSNPECPVLGLRFEEDHKALHRANLRLPPWFSNLLPEGRLREWIARTGLISVDREMDLLAQVGHDLPGAVCILPAQDIAPVDMSVGEMPRPIPENGSASLWHFSLAGVGLKLSLLTRGDRLVIPAVGDGGDWTLKLPDPDFPDLAYNEWAMMTLAGVVGIQVPKVRLVHREQIEALPERVWTGMGDYAYAVRRFDRDPRRRSIHIEDLAQVRGFYPDWKYRGSFETVGALIYRQHDPEALREFTRRLTFNVLIGNGDAHLKNWSLIYPDRRNPTLAPAYDLVATFVYRPDVEGSETMALKLGDSKRFETVGCSAFARLDGRRGQGRARCGHRNRVVRVREEWPRAAALLTG